MSEETFRSGTGSARPSIRRQSHLQSMNKQCETVGTATLCQKHTEKEPFPLFYSIEDGSVGLFPRVKGLLKIEIGFEGYDVSEI